ncbi:MAG: 30S ribosomal protein S1 [Planctomycetes bacterium]|nr:30S ribosomal protein S1 [Planctomycetota bacterium]
MRFNENLKKYDFSPEQLETSLATELAEAGFKDSAMETRFEKSVQNFEPDTIITGRILRIFGGDVVVDVGYKSEGIVPLDHFRSPDEVRPGDEVEVLIETMEDDTGLLLLSKRKADRIRGWERVVSTHKEGDVVRGRVSRKIKGGLLVEIGVPVFLPASQVGIRRVGDVSEYIGREVEAKIIKIDESRMNIVISRRKLIEERRDEQKKKLLATLKEGDVVKGVVKNIADFGAFVDLGGIDGLLHITDISWGRANHPSEVVQIDQELEVKVLKIDLAKERISLGLKQLAEDPWNRIDEKYPVGSRIKGQVVNVLTYGAFVKLEPGVEGLVHVSEMSWTKRINHPSEVVQAGDEVEVQILDIDKEKQEISLGMKQTEQNPWELVAAKYPEGTIIEGRVRNLTTYGAFVEIEEGIDGLLHVSDMSWTKKVVHPQDLIQKDDTVRAVVLSVDQEKKRIALGMKQLEEDPWDRDIPGRFAPGTMVTGKVTKITNFGVFVRLEENLEGLLHISELSTRKVENPQEVVSIGDRVKVKVIKIDTGERKIGLSIRQLIEEGEDPFDVAQEEEEY